MIKPIRIYCSAICLTVAFFAGNVTAAGWFQGLSKENPMIVDRAKGEIRLLTQLKPSRFEDGWFTQLPGHHAVTWKDGEKSDEALFMAYVSDSDFYDAMVSLGAKPGNNLTVKAWTERNNPDSEAAKAPVKGSRVDISVFWKGLEKPTPLKEILLDPSGRGVDMRFGGHKSLIPVWNSGCIVCMQSCPGGKISNHNYTLSDYAKGKAMFKPDYSVIPKGGRAGVVIFRLK